MANNRIDKMCPGDCSNCQLLQSGEVEMTSCILDQIFQRTQRNEKALADIAESIEELSEKEPKFAAISKKDTLPKT